MKLTLISSVVQRREIAEWISETMPHVHGSFLKSLGYGTNYAECSFKKDDNNSSRGDTKDEVTAAATYSAKDA